MVETHFFIFSPQIWETPFSQTDDKFPCSIDRINGPLADIDHMWVTCVHIMAAS